MLTPAIITVVRDPAHPLGKKFQRAPDGTISKQSAVSLSLGIAVQHEVKTHEELATLLSAVSNDPYAAIINSSFKGIEIGEEFIILSASEIEKRLGIPKSDRQRQQGVHKIEHDGKTLLAVCRFKENVIPSSWQLFDRDIDEHTPAKYADLTTEQLMAHVGTFLPGVENLTYVEVPSTSSRVMYLGKSVGSGNAHVWIKVSNPGDIERFRSAMLVLAAKHDMIWMKPRFSRTEKDKVVANSLTTILDPSVLTPGRLVFDGQPTVGEGLTVEPLKAIIHCGENDVLDLSAIVIPNAAELGDIGRKVGMTVKTDANGVGLKITANDLMLSTEVEAQAHGILTVRQIIERDITGKLRCQSPFRDSQSWAAFYSTNADGIPFIFDNGTNITHWLLKSEMPEAQLVRTPGVISQRMTDVRGDSACKPLDVVSPRDVAVVTECPKECEAELVARLASLKPMEYDHVRKEEAKALCIQVKTLDDMVRAGRNVSNASERLPFSVVEPWPEPVEPAALLGAIVALILRFIVMGKEQATAAALWVAFTWFTDEVQIAPLGIINAPEKACGKSQLLTVFGYLVCRPLPAANSSPAFLFRAMSMWKPTLLVDEADTFIRDNDELKGLVNAGHTRANAYVGRTVVVGDGHEPKLFDVWGAKAFAGIALEKHLPDATMSRGIIFNLRRKTSDEKVERLRHADKAIFAELSSKLMRFANDYSSQVRLAQPALPDALTDRSQDNWEPLLAIAGCAGVEWIKRATDAALALSGTSEASTSTGNELLTDIQYIFEKKGVTKVRSVELIAALVNDDELSWATYNRGNPLTPRQLAKLLDVYGVKPKTVRHGNETPKGYDLEQFADAFTRYLSPPEKLPQQRNAETLPGTSTATATTAENVADTPQQELPDFDAHDMMGCFGVAATTTTEDDSEY